mgnify:CR=1 FL=1
MKLFELAASAKPELGEEASATKLKFAPLIAECLDRGLKERESVPATCVWRCSSLTDCGLCVWKDAHGEKPKTTPERLKAYCVGQAVHDRIAKSLYHWVLTEDLSLAARPVGLEVALWDIKLRLGGRMDALFLVRDGDGAVLVGLEVKTANTWSMARLRAGGPKSAYWWWQVVAYTKLARAKWPGDHILHPYWGTVVYVESKDNSSDILLYEIKCDDAEEDWDLIERMLLNLNDALNAPVTPRRHPALACAYPKKCPHK